jgi:hypothetical protein
MATSKIAYSANTAITFDISSLAGSSTWLAGRESTQVDNSSNLYIDAIVNVDPITAGTTPAIGEVLELRIWGADTSLATTPIDVLDGTDSAETLSHDSIRQSLRLVKAVVATSTTTGQQIVIPPFSVASFFGGRMPKFWGLFLAHDHTNALGSGQSGLFSYNGITYTTT